MAEVDSISRVIDAGTGTPVQWRGLSRHLVGRIFPVEFQDNKDGSRTALEVVNSPSVRGPITESGLDFTLNWQSPFENTGPESKMPQLMAMIQSGQIGTIVNMLQAAGYVGENNSLANETKAISNKLQGRTGITRINSTQVFSGMAPVKLNFTIHFRAYSDSVSDVMQPYRTLLEWALPKKLADNSTIGNGINASKGEGSTIDKLLDVLFPSEAPQLIGFEYANQKYLPMVIEHLAHPIDGPLGADGLPLYRAVQVSLATLTALDKSDVAKIHTR